MNIFGFASKKDQYILFPNFEFEKKVDKDLVFFYEKCNLKVYQYKIVTGNENTCKYRISSSIHTKRVKYLGI